MVSKVFSVSLLGLDCQPIEVEVDYRHGLSHFAIVGLGDKSVQEAKERIVSAIRNSDAEYIPKRIIVNLAPADLPKSGPLFDLAIAAGLLLSTEQLKFDPKGKIFLGELALNGALRPIHGVLPLVSGVKQLGFKQVFLPEANVAEASLIEGIEIFAVPDLRSFISHFHSTPLQAVSYEQRPSYTTNYTEFDLADVKSQVHAKRALTIAAAGSHNVLLSGVPGAGKTLLAKCMPGILPTMTIEESLEATKVHSVSGMVRREEPLVTTRPFRSPHHSISNVALVGGGASPRPGEISLAHRGVLFMDEFAEFSSAALEALRQPLEENRITISRAAYAVTYPSNFLLVAAMNPCRCGYLGDPNRRCTCSPLEVSRYRRKISGPILDRIDLQINVRKVDPSKLAHAEEASSSSQARTLVEGARDLQLERYSTLPNIVSNSEAPQTYLTEHTRLDLRSKEFLVKAVGTLGLSARGYFRLLRVARTIADVEGSSEVKYDHIAEAVSYRVAFASAT